MADSVVDALDQLSVTASLAGDRIVKMVANQTVIDRHWEVWNENAQVIGDTLLDPLPISWERSIAFQEAQ